ncbi:4Fe-4S binding protein [Geosporobacter ferrireducens]|uniref:4Fe-4S ferredoxin n=1 Tax=Geosporobacter ferrireducens TaxID=1424294 RepID=A0A1D8GNE0_9FIRM|nr:4Fe-4S binding protein [Geosporobacter ferrireducens]AOT72440.1 4Fe-4S ferredoxin [Geosporobacter ferrireducens]MTI56300.1 4Fe-4S binding protein [Geosporobacter ferrireducens]
MKIIDFLKSRPFIQAIASVVTNANIGGFLTGKIWKGNSKIVCVPGLNCYSCPGALGACPIGALQAVLGGNKHNFSFYVIGILILFGVVFGRLICGFLCLFGFIQDLLYRIPVPKFKIPQRMDRPLRGFKYIVLIVPVITLPILLTNQFGIASPYFCQWICPAGTLQGGIPLVIKNESLRNMLGFLWSWKMSILTFIVVASILTYRPFCKYICPLGAVYSLFNRFSFYQMHVDKSKCNGCMICEKKCKMNVEITKNINSLECIRCNDCKGVCKGGAITSKFCLKEKKNEVDEVPHICKCVIIVTHSKKVSSVADEVWGMKDGNLTNVK